MLQAAQRQVNQARQKKKVRQQAQRIRHQSFAVAPEPVARAPTSLPSRAAPNTASAMPVTQRVRCRMAVLVVRGKYSRVATKPFSPLHDRRKQLAVAFVVDIDADFVVFRQAFGIEDLAALAQPAVPKSRARNRCRRRSTAQTIR